jgi:hypothetical protein
MFQLGSSQKGINIVPEETLTVREVGPLVRIKWQFFDWNQQVQGPEREEDIPEEITFPKFVGHYLVKETGDRIQPQARFRVSDEIPTQIPPGSLIKVEAMEIPSMKDVLAGAKDSAALLGQMTPPALPASPVTRKIRVFIKQEQWEVDPMERWLYVSGRIAARYGMPNLALFKFKPVDGDIEVQTPQGGSEVYAFDWKPVMQCWPTCEYDAFADQHRQEWRLIVIMDEEGHEEALAV